MALFNKKFCDICGGSMGIIIDNKAADGNFCHTCAGKLSPFFHNARKSTLQQIQQQIMYREQNRQALNYFSPTKVIGNKTKVYIDEAKRKFIVSKKSDYKAENADIIDISQVLSVVPNVREHKTELYTKDAQGNRKSYNPPRYDYSYEFEMTISVNTPYFNEIKFDLTDTTNRPKSRNSQEYMQYEQMANQIVAYLKGGAMPGGAVGGIGGVVGAVMGGMNNTGGLGGIVGSVMGGMNNNNGMNNMNSMNAGMNTGMNTGMNNMGNTGGGLGGVVGAAMGALGLGAMAGQQNNAGFGQNNGYAQQNMGFDQNNAYGQQNMGYNQNNGYGQQNMGYNQNNAYGQQNMGYNQNNDFNQQNNMGFGQQNFGMGGYQWVCPNCGTTNTANFCQGCGRQRG